MLKTEHQSAQYAGLDTWKDEAILSALAESQAAAISSVRQAFSSISRAAADLADRLRAGGRLLYAGAGSSIRQGIVDGIELPATFGFPPERLHFLVAGGKEALFDSRGAAEDDAASATAEIATLRLTAQDSLIAIAASGTTPYAVAAARAARATGALVIAIANNPRSPLAEAANHEIFLNSGPEVIAGSTRMAAGTAQKCALNLLSTLTHIRLGAVHDGMMVNVRADNEKLRRRACGIVMTIAGVDEAAARRALDTANGEVKFAVLVAAGVKDLGKARDMLGAAKGNLRLALSQLSK
ncbi:MAG: N-acetylmuramic acid 6-phosphate etherase [Aestuariivirgaceae bacterium]